LVRRGLPGGFWVFTLVFSLLFFSSEKGLAMKLSSPDFSAGGALPESSAYRGENRRPELHIEGVPEGTAALALIMDDPDAPVGTWTHWIVWNLPPDTKVISSDRLPAGAVEGKNDYGEIGYGGPAPPSGTHRYFFTLYALKEPLHLPRGADRRRFEAALSGKVLAKATLMGTFSARR
jgi:Raf kinase inhibitor-like YbhB/YbcL family protein